MCLSDTKKQVSFLQKKEKSSKNYAQVKRSFRDYKGSSFSSAKRDNMEAREKSLTWPLSKSNVYYKVIKLYSYKVSPTCVTHCKAGKSKEI